MTGVPGSSCSLGSIKCCIVGSDCRLAGVIGSGCATASVERSGCTM